MSEFDDNLSRQQSVVADLHSLSRTDISLTYHGSVAPHAIYASTTDYNQTNGHGTEGSLPAIRTKSL